MTLDWYDQNDVEQVPGQRKRKPALLGAPDDYDYDVWKDYPGGDAAIGASPTPAPVPAPPPPPSIVRIKPPPAPRPGWGVPAGSDFGLTYRFDKDGAGDPALDYRPHLDASGQNGAGRDPDSNYSFDQKKQTAQLYRDLSGEGSLPSLGSVNQRLDKIFPDHPTTAELIKSTIAPLAPNWAGEIGHPALRERTLQAVEGAVRHILGDKRPYDYLKHAQARIATHGDTPLDNPQYGSFTVRENTGPDGAKQSLMSNPPAYISDANPPSVLRKIQHNTSGTDPNNGEIGRSISEPKFDAKLPNDKVDTRQRRQEVNNLVGAVRLGRISRLEADKRIDALFTEHPEIAQAFKDQFAAILTGRPDDPPPSSPDLSSEPQYRLNILNRKVQNGEWPPHSDTGGTALTEPQFDPRARTNPAIIDLVVDIMDATPANRIELIKRAVALFGPSQKMADVKWVIDRNATLPLDDPRRAANTRQIEEEIIEPSAAGKALLMSLGLIGLKASGAATKPIKDLGIRSAVPRLDPRRSPIENFQSLRNSVSRLFDERYGTDPVGMNADYINQFLMKPEFAHLTNIQKGQLRGIISRRILGRAAEMDAQKALSDFLENSDYVGLPDRPVPASNLGLPGFGHNSGAAGRQRISSNFVNSEGGKVKFDSQLVPRDITSDQMDAIVRATIDSATRIPFFWVEFKSSQARLSRGQSVADRDFIDAGRPDLLMKINIPMQKVSSEAYVRALSDYLMTPGKNAQPWQVDVIKRVVDSMINSLPKEMSAGTATLLMRNALIGLTTQSANEPNLRR